MLRRRIIRILSRSLLREKPRRRIVSPKGSAYPLFPAFRHGTITMPPLPRTAALIVALALGSTGPGAAEVDAGAYLSARAALQAGDYCRAR